MLIKVPSRDAAEVVGALSKHVRKLPAILRRSLTWDRGLEMAKHKDFTETVSSTKDSKREAPFLP